MQLSVKVHIAASHRRKALADDIRQGLTALRKSIPPVWFYDERGSALFDEITRLPEYYPTGAERSILAAHADDVARLAKSETLVELGSGTSEKTTLLLDAMAETGLLRRFVPFDVSEEILRQAAAAVSERYGIEVLAVVGDFHRHLHEIPRTGRRLIAFLGGTIGNLVPDQRRRFLFDLDATMDHDDHLLLGVDLVKDPARLVAAYDDAAGVTAEFNRNVLAVLNVELGAHFDLAAFDHVALWNEDQQWIEMRLRSRVRQTVAIDDLDLDVDFEAGEDVLTEISTKFTPGRLENELWDAGFVLDQSWTDEAGDFLLTLARPYC